MSKNAEFTKLRAILFPIHNDELKKFLPMGIILLLVLFNYTVLRNTKDALIATGAGAGVEAIPYLKSIFVMSSAVVFVILYTKLANIFSAEKLFYGIVSVFLIFFGLFSYVLYPNLDVLHPNLDLVHSLQAEFPRLKFLFSVWGVWTYSLFYIMSELWGSAMISLLFWQFANEIIRSEEAKRFYPLFVLIGNLALLLSGEVVSTFSDIRESLPADVDAWGISLKYLAIAIIGAGFLAMALYRWMHTHVLIDPKYYDAAGPKKEKKQKPKMGMWESFVYIFSNPYIGLIALLVLSYGMSINLVEFIWKKQLAIHYAGDPNGYNAFMGRFSQATGLTTILVIFLTKGVVRKFGWFVGAVITPVILAVTSAIFFTLILMEDLMSPLIAGLGLSAAFSATFIAILVGAVQNFLTKAAKYSFFDPTKEMAYIPLDQELKVKGKAVVDVIGGRMGKALGGYTIMFLFFITAATDGMVLAPYLGIFIGLVVLAWIVGVVTLNKRYTNLVAAQALEKAKETA